MKWTPTFPAYTCIIFTIFLFVTGCSSTPSPNSSSSEYKTTSFYKQLDQDIQKWMKAYKKGNISQLKPLRKQISDQLQHQKSHIIQTLKKKHDSTKQTVAAAALSFLPPSRKTLSSITEGLQNESEPVQKNTLLSLALIKVDWTRFPDVHKNIVNHLLSNWKTHRETHPESLYFSIPSLIQPHNDHGFLPRLRQGLNSENEKIRQHCLRALTSLHQPKALNLILNKALLEESRSVQLHALFALHKHPLTKKKKSSVTDHLIRLLQDFSNRSSPPERLIDLAIDLLHTLHQQPALNTPSKWIRWYNHQ